MPKNDGKEQWLEIPGANGYYQVSTHGRIRSVDRLLIYTDGRRRRWKGKILQLQQLKPGKGETRYWSTRLSLNGVKRTYYVHDLVLTTFIGPRPVGQQARHGPKGSLNNWLTNLSYGTPAENMLDKLRDGTLWCRAVRRSDGKEYPSITAAACDVGRSVTTLHNALSGKRPTAAGFFWRYIENS